MYPNVHSSTIYNSKDIETTQMPNNRWKDKEDMVYTHNGILVSYLKKKNEIVLFAATCMDLEIVILSGISQTGKDNIIWYHLYV